MAKVICVIHFQEHEWKRNVFLLWASLLEQQKEQFFALKK
jgi:hypothetical protein